MIGLSLGAPVMMQLGGYQFGINTAAYQELQRSTEYRWAEQERMGRMPALQFTGEGADAITLTGTIYPEYRGGNWQIDDMRSLAKQGKPQLLIDGFGRLFGRFVILDIQETQSVFAAFGRARKQEFTLKLRKREP